MVDAIQSATVAVANRVPTSARPTFHKAARAPLKIALEEAIATHVYNATATLPPVDGTAELPYVDKAYVTDVKHRLTDLESRVESMDKAGIALTVVSLTMFVSHQQPFAQHS